MANYIHSTASQNMVYPIYADGKQNQARIIRKITIRGTANVVDPGTFVTPEGAVTEVSDQDLADLRKSAAFQRHVEKGFMRVRTVQNLDTREMEKRDGSAQLLDEEFATGKDLRTPDSGNCKASCGRNDRIKGKKGLAFVAEGD